MASLARICWTIFVCLTVGLGSFYFVAAEHLFPALQSDGASHVAPILNYKSGHGFGSVVWALTRDYDPTGQHRFLQYPPLFHLVVARLIPRASILDIYLCLAAFTVASLLLYVGLILQRPVSGPVRGRPLWIALAGVSLVAVSTWFYQLPSAGRTEALATPLLILAAIVVPRTSARWQAPAAGVFIGVLGATQTAVAILAGLLYSVFVSTRTAERPVPVTRWLVSVAVAGVVSLAVFTACLLLSPYSLPETVRGIFVHFSQLPNLHLSVISYYLFPAISGTFHGLFFLVLLAHYVWWQRSRLGVLGAANLAVFVAAAWLLAIHHPNRCYNLLPFTPIFVALALALVARLETPQAAALRVNSWQRGLIYAGYFGVFALMGVGFVRQAALYMVFTQKGVSYEEAARSLHAQFPTDDQTPVLFDGGVFPLLDHYDHAYQHILDGTQLDPVPGATRPVVLIHQWYGRLLTPPEIPGYHLVWNDFATQPPPHVLGLKVANAMPGYAFALYKPDAP